MSNPNKRIHKNINIDNLNCKIINCHKEFSFRDKKIFPGGQFTMDSSLNAITGFDRHEPGQDKYYIWDHTDTDLDAHPAIFTQYNYVGINNEPDQDKIRLRTQPTLDLVSLDGDGQIRIGEPPIIPGISSGSYNHYSIDNNANDNYTNQQYNSNNELISQTNPIWDAPNGTIVYSTEMANGGHLFYKDNGIWFRLLAKNEAIIDISTNWSVNNQTIHIQDDANGDSQITINKMTLGVSTSYDISNNTDNLRIHDNNGGPINIKLSIKDQDPDPDITSNFNLTFTKQSKVSYDISYNNTSEAWHNFTVNNQNILCTRFIDDTNYPAIGLGTTNPKAFIDVSSATLFDTSVNYIKMGTNNTISGNSSVILGIGNDISGQLLFTHGSNNINQGKFSVIFGDNNKIQSNNNDDNDFNFINGKDNDISNSSLSFITGISNELIQGSQSFICGNENYIADVVNFTVGSNNTIYYGHNNHIFGENNDISGSLNLVHGNSNKISIGSNHIVLGDNNVTSDQSSFIIGISNEVSVCESVAIGFKNITGNNAKHSFAIGNENEIQSRYGITIGVSNEILNEGGQHSIAIGTRNIITGVNNAIAMGQDTYITDSNMRFAFGTSGDDNKNLAGNKIIIMKDGRMVIGPSGGLLTDIVDKDHRLQIDNNENTIAFLRNVDPTSSQLAVVQYGSTNKTFGAIGGIDLTTNNNNGLGGLVFYVNNLSSIESENILPQYNPNGGLGLSECMRVDNSGILLINLKSNPEHTNLLDAYIGDTSIRINPNYNRLAIAGNCFIQPEMSFISYSDNSGAHILLQDMSGDSYFQNDNSNCKIVIGTQKNYFEVNNHQFNYRIGNKQPLTITEEDANDFYFQADTLYFNAKTIGLGLHQKYKVTDPSSQVIIDSSNNTDIDNHLTLIGHINDISYVQLRLEATNHDDLYFGRHADNNSGFIKNYNKNTNVLTFDFSENKLGINTIHKDTLNSHLDISSNSGSTGIHVKTSANDTGLHIKGSRQILLENETGTKLQMYFENDLSGFIINKPFTMNAFPDDTGVEFTLTGDASGIKINQIDSNDAPINEDHVVFQHRGQELKNKHIKGNNNTWSQQNRNKEGISGETFEDKSIWRIADKSGNNVFTGTNRFQDSIILQQKGNFADDLEIRDLNKPRVLLDVSGFDISYNGINYQPYLIIDASSVQLPLVTIDHINSDVSDNGVLGQVRYNKQYKLFEGFHEISGNLGGWKSLSGINDMSGTRMDSVIESEDIIGSHPRTKIAFFVNDVSMGWIDASGLTIYNNDITIKGSGEFYRDYDGQPRTDDLDINMRKKIDNYWTQTDHFTNLDHDPNLLNISEENIELTRDYIYRTKPVILGRDKPNKAHGNQSELSVEFPFYMLDVSGGLYCDKLYLGTNHYHFIDYESGTNADSSTDITYSMSDFTIGDPEGNAIMSLIGGISGEDVPLHSYILMGSGKKGDISGSKLEIKWDGSNCKFDNNIDVSGTLTTDKLWIGDLDSDLSNIPLVINSANTYTYDTGIGQLYEGATSSADSDFSLYTEKNIFINGGYLFVKSDIRIKTNINDVPDDLALTQIRNIPCKYYNYKDTAERGYDKTIGFIAQDVQKVMPMAVKTVSGFIPSIMKTIENPRWINTNDGYFSLSLEELDVQPGMIMRIYFSNAMERNIQRDIIIDASYSIVTNKEYNNVFVYGEHVTDMHILNKEKIFTLHHSAIQALDKQLLDLHAKTENCLIYTNLTQNNTNAFVTTTEMLKTEFQEIKKTCEIINEDFVLLKHNFENRLDTEIHQVKEICNELTHLKFTETENGMGLINKECSITKSLINKNLNNINTLLQFSTDTSGKIENNVMGISNLSKEIRNHRSDYSLEKQANLLELNYITENFKSSTQVLTNNIETIFTQLAKNADIAEKEIKYVKGTLQQMNESRTPLFKNIIKANTLDAKNISSKHAIAHTSNVHFALKNKDLKICDEDMIQNYTDIVDTDEVLDIVNKIQCKKITYKDVKHQSSSIINFVPRSLFDILPECITKTKNIVCDGMMLLQDISWLKDDINNNWILTINDVIGVNNDLKIKVFCSNHITIGNTHYLSEDEVMEITTIFNNNQCNLNNKYTYVYYYGKEKTNTSHFDIEQIVAIQHVAIQELSKQIKNEQGRNSYLEDRITVLENLVRG